MWSQAKKPLDCRFRPDLRDPLRCNVHPLVPPQRDAIAEAEEEHARTLNDRWHGFGQQSHMGVINLESLMEQAVEAEIAIAVVVAAALKVKQLAKAVCNVTLDAVLVLGRARQCVIIAGYRRVRRERERREQRRERRRRVRRRHGRCVVGNLVRVVEPTVEPVV